MSSVYVSEEKQVFHVENCVVDCITVADQLAVYVFVMRKGLCAVEIIAEHFNESEAHIQAVVNNLVNDGYLVEA